MTTSPVGEYRDTERSSSPHQGAVQHSLGVHVVVVVERLHDGEVSVEADTAEVEGAHLARRGCQGGQEAGRAGGQGKIQRNNEKQGGAGRNSE